MTDNVISTDQGTGRMAPARQTGFYYNWGPQAWIDMWMSNSMLVKKAMPIVSHTFVPILRLSGDKEQVDRDYADVKSRREILKWSDSPREKWRKRYGNFVREEGCLNICKGPFEALFNGEGGGLKMEFDPHLPETSCTVRMSWQTAGNTGAAGHAQVA